MRSPLDPRSFAPEHFTWSFARGVGTITLDRPEKLNSLTFASYLELADTFDALNAVDDVRSVVITGRGRGFCSGGDQDDIIAELFARDMQGLVEFTRVTGRLIHSIRRLRRPVICAVNGVAVGAGAVIAIACDMRIATAKARFGFVFPKVGLCGADMGATYLLPKIVGLGHASEILFMGDLVGAEQALRIGLVNRVVQSPQECVDLAQEWALKLAKGPAFANSMTKQMLESEAQMNLSDAIEAEAQVQAICMQHPDFKTAHHAFKNKEEPVFAGAEITEEVP